MTQLADAPTQASDTSPAPASITKKPRPPSSAPARAIRLQRIYARLQEGYSLAEIARAESLSRERVRQILVAARASHRDEDRPDHARMQIARLAPVLRQAVRAATQGANGAVKELFAVLDRLDRYLDPSKSYRKISVDELGEGDARLNAVTDRDRLLARRTGEVDQLLAEVKAHLRTGADSDTLDDAIEAFEKDEEEEDDEDFDDDEEDFNDDEDARGLQG